MIAAWVAFFAGLVVGIIGVLGLALCMAAGRSETQSHVPTDPRQLTLLSDDVDP